MPPCPAPVFHKLRCLFRHVQSPIQECQFQFIHCVCVTFVVAEAMLAEAMLAENATTVVSATVSTILVIVDGSNEQNSFIQF